MINNIINEIRRIELKYYSKYCERGEIICLDANTETRLAAYLIFVLSSDECCFVSYTTNSDEGIVEILENGIRHLNIIIAGMKLKFDCPSFCIKNTFGNDPIQNICHIYPINQE